MPIRSPGLTPGSVTHGRGPNRLRGLAVQPEHNGLVGDLEQERREHIRVEDNHSAKFGVLITQHYRIVRSLALLFGDLTPPRRNLLRG